MNVEFTVHAAKMEKEKSGETVIPDNDPLTMTDISGHPLFKLAYEMAYEYSRQVKPMTPGEISIYVRHTIASLSGYDFEKKRTINNKLEWPVPLSVNAWEQSITEDHITCMICGKKMKLLTRLHIKNHGGTKADYYEHFQIPSDVRLCAQEVTELRRHLISKQCIWQQRKLKNMDEKIERKELTLEDILAAEANILPPGFVPFD